jgi:hypothetical protein
MKSQSYKKFCSETYQQLFTKYSEAIRNGSAEERRREAQRIAIRETSIAAMRQFADMDPAEIWKTIYIAHVHNISGIDDDTVIASVISADNSWKKSSGHAFEEMIQELGNLALREHGIEILLQKEVNVLLKEQHLINEVRDISWLKEQIASSIFDLYLTLKTNEGYQIYGCIQSKTSVRDRVTRDREPSINAMKAFFMSVAIVLNGDFLRLPKFKNMVNGDSAEFKTNGWHGMYVFSKDTSIGIDRIHIMDIEMKPFVRDAIAGAKAWKEQRQWFNETWRAK